MEAVEPSGLSEPWRIKEQVKMVACPRTASDRPCAGAAKIRQGDARERGCAFQGRCGDIEAGAKGGVKAVPATYASYSPCINAGRCSAMSALVSCSPRRVKRSIHAGLMAEKSVG